MTAKLMHNECPNGDACPTIAKIANQLDRIERSIRGDPDMGQPGIIEMQRLNEARITKLDEQTNRRLTSMERIITLGAGGWGVMTIGWTVWTHWPHK